MPRITKPTDRLDALINIEMIDIQLLYSKK